LSTLFLNGLYQTFLIVFSAD